MKVPVSSLDVEVPCCTAAVRERGVDRGGQALITLDRCTARVMSARIKGLPREERVRRSLQARGSVADTSVEVLEGHPARVSGQG